MSNGLKPFWAYESAMLGVCFITCCCCITSCFPFSIHSKVTDSISNINIQHRCKHFRLRREAKATHLSLGYAAWKRHNKRLQNSHCRSCELVAKAKWDSQGEKIEREADASFRRSSWEVWKRQDWKNINRWMTAIMSSGHAGSPLDMLSAASHRSRQVYLPGLQQLVATASVE